MRKPDNYYSINHPPEHCGGWEWIDNDPDDENFCDWLYLTLWSYVQR